MDVLQRALRTQQSSDELVDVLHLVPPLSPRLLSMDLTTAMNGTTNAQYQRLLQAYAAYAKLIGTATELPNDAISLARVADAALEICAGFNYAFDHAWMLPLAKRVFTFSVEVAVRCDALYDAEMVKEGTGASLAHPEKIKAVCVLLDALRAKMMDRGQFPNTRKAGILFTLNLIFRCYLRVCVVVHYQD